LGIFGKAVNAYLIPLEAATSIIGISGFIGKPEYARKKYGEQFFFVNNRFIRHPYFHKTVLEGYEQILAADHIPSYFIFLNVDPSRIDVNIHPSKTEVKFEEEQAVRQILLASVREAIGRYHLAPSLDFSKEGVIDIPVLRADTQIKSPVIETNPVFNPFENEPDYRREKKIRPYLDERFSQWEQMFEPGPGSLGSGSKYMQVKNKYILSPVKSGLMVIDQRRARERILYEKMVTSRREQNPLAQETLFPETIQLNAEDYQVCLEMMDELESLGYDIRDLGNRSVVIHGMPSELDVSVNRAADLLEMMIEQYKTLQGIETDGMTEKIIRSAARSAAIGYNRPLTELEMQELTDQLFACPNPNYSPSGFLIVRILELGELDKQFNS
jgi:DNA mismatch repair protein MutL